MQLNLIWNFTFYDLRVKNFLSLGCSCNIKGLWVHVLESYYLTPKSISLWTENVFFGVFRNCKILYLICYLWQACTSKLVKSCTKIMKILMWAKKRTIFLFCFSTVTCALILFISGGKQDCCYTHTVAGGWQEPSWVVGQNSEFWRLHGAWKDSGIHIKMSKCSLWYTESQRGNHNCIQGRCIIHKH